MHIVPLVTIPQVQNSVVDPVDAYQHLLSIAPTHHVNQLTPTVHPCLKRILCHYNPTTLCIAGRELGA